MARALANPEEHVTPPANNNNEEDSKNGILFSDCFDANKFFECKVVNWVFGVEIKPLRKDAWIPFLNIVLSACFLVFDLG